jgi:hypothetical protein
MKSNQYRSHSVGAALAATIVTAVLVATLVESFEPAQLLRFADGAADAPIVALDRRAGDAARTQA